MLGRSRPHPGEIPSSSLGTLPEDGFELVRLWLSASEGRMHVSVSRQNDWVPNLVGSLLVECARTVAASYAQRGDISEEEAFSQILKGMDEERVRLSGSGV